MKFRLHLPARYNSIQGFTFIELLITVAITMFLFSGIIAGYNRFTAVTRVKQAALTLKNDLRLAQTKAQNGQKPIQVPCDELTGYQVAFSVTHPTPTTNITTYSIQAQCNPSEPLVPSTTITLPALVTFSPVPPPILFGVLTRGANISSDLTITLMSGSMKYDMKVTPQGDIIEVGFE